MNRSLSIVAILLCTGCTSSSISSNIQRSSKPINTIAISPSSGMFGDAVGIELSNRNFVVYDSGQSATLLVTAGISEIEFYQPSRTKTIQDKGIDAILVVKATAGYDGNPDNATVKLVSLKDGKLIVGANWQNGHGGMMGSPMDRNSRSGLVEAAAQISAVIEKATR